jgi:hypothetical protein
MFRMMASMMYAANLRQKPPYCGMTSPFFSVVGEGEHRLGAHANQKGEPLAAPLPGFVNQTSFLPAESR